MRKQLFFLLTFIVCGVLCIQAQTDVTDTYIRNAGFEEDPVTFPTADGRVNPNSVQYSNSGLGSRVYEVPDWTVTIAGGEWCRMATGKYGINYTSVPDALNGTVFPTTDRTGAYLALSGAYGSTATLTQQVTLPPGNYQLIFDVYNINPGSTFTNLFGFEPDNGTPVYSEQKDYPAQWSTGTVSFDISKETTGRIRIGIQGNSSGSGSNARLAVDNIKILYKEIDVSYLVSKIEEAKAVLALDNGIKYAADALQYEIDNAETIVENGGDIIDAVDKLNTAIEAYNISIEVRNTFTDVITAARTLADDITLAEVKAKLEEEIIRAEGVLQTAPAKSDVEETISFMNSLLNFARDIETAQTTYNTTQEGNNTGQYPSEARLEFKTAIDVAVAVFKVVVSAEDIQPERQKLSEARTLYLATEVKGVFIPSPEKSYIIRHASNLVLTQTSDGKAKIKVETLDVNQLFSMSPAATADSYHIISVKDGRLLAKSGSYSLVWLEDTDGNRANTATHFKVEYKTALNYVINCATTSGYLGTDNTTDDSEIYSDKSGTDANRHYWKFEEYIPQAVLLEDINATQAMADTITDTVIKTALETAVSNARQVANDPDATEEQLKEQVSFLRTMREFAATILDAAALYDSTTEGNEQGQYPADARNELKTVIDNAKTTIAKSGLTLEQLQEAVAVLQEAVKTYNTSEVLPKVNAVQGAQYRIMMLKNDGSDEVRGYATKAADGDRLHPQPEKEETDRQLFYLVREEGGGVDDYYLKNVDNGKYLSGSGSSVTDQNPELVLRFIYQKEVIVDGVSVPHFKIYKKDESKENGIDWMWGYDSNGNSFWSDKSDDIFRVEMKAFKDLLSEKITEYTQIIDAAVTDGTPGNYTPEPAQTFREAIAQAQQVYDNPSATDDEIRQAITDLQAALDVFYASRLDLFPYNVYIIHSGGNLLSRVDTLTSPVLFDVGRSENQSFRIVAAGEDYAIASPEGSGFKYLTYTGGWSTYWGDTISAESKIQILDTEDGYKNIKFVTKSYLGTDNGDEGALTYSDKSASAMNSKWDIQEAGKVIKTKLKKALFDANKKYEETEEGTAFYQYPQADRIAFKAKIDAAEPFVTDENATQDEIDLQTSILLEALQAYIDAQILPYFRPEADTEYFLKNKANQDNYVDFDEEGLFTDIMIPTVGFVFEKLEDKLFVIKTGDKVLTHDLTLETYNAGDNSHKWYINYANSTFGTDTIEYYSFAATDSLHQVLSQNGTRFELLEEYTGDSKQCFNIIPVGEPIKSLLDALIANARSILSSTVGGSDFLQYPMDLRNDLEEKLQMAEEVIAEETATQADINQAYYLLKAAYDLYEGSQNLIEIKDDGTTYRIINRSSGKPMSRVDTDLKAGELIADTIDGALLFTFEKIEGKKNNYYLKNGDGYLTSTFGFLQTPTGWQLEYRTTDNNIDYYNIKIDGRNIRINGDGYSLNTYPNEWQEQFYFVEVSPLESYIPVALSVLNKAELGNTYGKYTENVYNEFLASIVSAREALSADEDVQAQQLENLKAAEEIFKNSFNGADIDYKEMAASLDSARMYITETTVIGNAAGQCPRAVIEALQEAVNTAADFDFLQEYGSVVALQTALDEAVALLNKSITVFINDLKESTQLPALIQTATEKNNLIEAGTDPGKVSQAAKDKLTAAIEVARAALDATNVSQLALLSAHDELADVYAEFLLSIIPLDIRELEEVIEKAEDFLLGKPSTEYTALREKLSEAIALIDKAINFETTQDEIDAMKSELEALLPTDGIGNIYNNSLVMFISNNELVIKGILENCDIFIYNLGGQLISMESVPVGEYKKAMIQGEYIIYLQGENINKREVIVVK